MRRLPAATLTLASALAFAHGAAPAAPQEGQPLVPHAVTPPYPAIARAARVAGVVNVDVEIDAEGGVTSAKADEASHPLLRKSAEDAALRWKFARSTTRRYARLTFEFRREPRDEEEPEEQTPSPYHVIVQRTRKKTVSHVPADAKNKSCGVHGYRLETEKIKIVYGLHFQITYGPDDGPSDYDDARRALFPNADPDFFGGGDNVDEDRPEFAEVLYCAACRLARESWVQAHPLPEDGD